MQTALKRDHQHTTGSRSKLERLPESNRSSHPLPTDHRSLAVVFLRGTAHPPGALPAAGEPGPREQVFSVLLSSWLGTMHRVRSVFRRTEMQVGIRPEKQSSRQDQGEARWRAQGEQHPFAQQPSGLIHAVILRGDTADVETALLDADSLIRSACTAVQGFCECTRSVRRPCLLGRRISRSQLDCPNPIM